jgi:uncharacterized protein YcfJ
MNNIRMMIATGLLLGMGTACVNDAAAATHCHDRVVYRERHSDNHHVVGTAVGAVAGAVIGHQIGGGSGRTIATVGGAVAGGAIGHHVAKEESHRRYRTVERVCTHD